MKQAETERMLAMLLDTLDILPPGEMGKLIDQVLSADVVDLGPTREDYVQWKGMLAALKAAGRVDPCSREFWKRLAGGGPSEMLAVTGMEGYARLCAVTLMGETLNRMATRELSEAEELNDAGYQLHHPGGWEKAIEFHDRAIALERVYPIAWINKGIALKNLRRFDEAIGCYDHVIARLGGEHKKAWHNKGVALKEKGLLEEAVACFSRALAIDPGYAVAQRVRQMCLDEQQHAGALSTPGADALASALGSNPQALQLFRMAQSYEEQGSWGVAARLLEQVVRLVPGHALLHNEHGHALFESGAHGAAEQVFEQVTRSHPGFGPAWSNLARCRLQRRDAPGAVEATGKAIELTPRDATAWAYRAVALHLLSCGEEALRAAVQAAQIDSHNPLALYWLGVTASLEGYKEQARLAFERLLALHPAFPARAEVQRLLEEL